MQRGKKNLRQEITVAEIFELGLIIEPAIGKVKSNSNQGGQKKKKREICLQDFFHLDFLFRIRE